MSAIRYASVVQGLQAQRCAFWRPLGGYLVPLSGGDCRIKRDPVPGDMRLPSPAPIPERVVQAAMATGMPLRREGDLFGSAA